MPKIIENVRGMLIEECQNQITANGYDNVTIRSIAKGCGLGLGTFYNYFKSKDMLIATFLLEDWKTRMEKIIKKNESEADPMVAVFDIYNELHNFTRAHYSIFTAPSAIKAFNMSGANYHKFVRNQVAAPIYNSCVISGFENAEFLSLYVAESLITWTVAEKEYEEIAAVVSKLFVK